MHDHNLQTENNDTKQDLEVHSTIVDDMPGESGRVHASAEARCVLAISHEYQSRNHVWHSCFSAQFSQPLFDILGFRV